MIEIKTDIEIAQAAPMLPIEEIAEQIGLKKDMLESYGRYKAKGDIHALKDLPRKAKLILVTAISPTPAGEGKTTTSVGLADALNRLGKKTIVCLREPSLGPVFGVKGGAAGGGYAQVIPMEDINLHFTGDFHAIGIANNLLSAMIDNHIQQGNALNIDTRKIVWKRVVDMNDRQLRHIVCGLGGKASGVPREDGFDITVASEIMAVLCLSSGLADMKARLARMVVAYTRDDHPITAHDLKAEGAMAAVLKDAIKPNLVQTLEHTPAFIHGGPFANIAHGCNSVRATKTALKLGDYAITEAGFGSDLGAEKFFDIKCRYAGLTPACVVLVSTVRSMKYNGGGPKDQLKEENLDALRAGSVNLLAHIENLKKFGVPVVVAINHFYADTQAEIDYVEQICKAAGADFAVTKCFAEGGAGSLELAEKVAAACEKENHFHTLYDLDLPVYEKIEKIAKEVYGADGVDYTKAAKKAIDGFIALGADKLPVCMAKTQYSLSDDPTKLGRPSGFRITVSSASLSAGAGFLVCQTGNVMTMPGLSKSPAAYRIDVDDQGNTVGLF